MMHCSGRKFAVQKAHPRAPSICYDGDGLGFLCRLVRSMNDVDAAIAKYGTSCFTSVSGILCLRHLTSYGLSCIGKVEFI